MIDFAAGGGTTMCSKKASQMPGYPHPVGPSKGNLGALGPFLSFDGNYVNHSRYPWKGAGVEEKFDPIRVMFTAFALASFGGLAALLRSEKVLTLRAIFAATFYSGITGLIIGLLWYNYFNAQGNIYFLLGVSALAGIGGTTVIDFLLQALLRMIKSGGLNVTFGPNRDGPLQPEDNHE